MNQINPEHTPQTENQRNIPTIQTEVAQIAMFPEITETAGFQEILSEIPVRVDKASELLANYRKDPVKFVNDIDEDDFDNMLDDMKSVTTFVRDINRSKTEINKFFNQAKSYVLGTIDQRLTSARYDELQAAEADIKQLKKDVEADRREMRWNEIKATFNANIERYPILFEFAPELTDFSKFKLLNAKLISGAKTRKVKESDHAVVNDTVYRWVTGIELIRENEWNLSPQDQNTLLTLFKQNPSIEIVREQGRQLKLNAEAKERARIAEEERRREAEEKAKIETARREAEMARIQEQERVAREKRDAEAVERARREAIELEELRKQQEAEERRKQIEYATFGEQYQTIFKESFPKFMAYLFNNPAYHNVHSSPKTKAAVIYDIMRQIERPDSVVSQETNKDPQKTLDLVRYVLDA